MSDVTDRPMLPADPDSSPYWEAIDRGELRVQRCTSCATWRWPARAMCNRCFGFDHDWPAVSGKGTVASWVRTHRAFLPQFADDLPYVTVTVRLAEQPDLLLVGQLADSHVEPEIGMLVRAVFHGVSEGRGLVFWEPEA
jgi:uncharacterized OB-fold protein